MAQFVWYDCTFKKQCTLPETLTFDLWRSIFFLWIEYNPISILYKFQINISSNSREIKYQNIGRTHTQTDTHTNRHTDRQTYRQTDRQTGWKQYLATPSSGEVNIDVMRLYILAEWGWITCSVVRNIVHACFDYYILKIINTDQLTKMVLIVNRRGHRRYMYIYVLYVLCACSNVSTIESKAPGTIR